MKNNSHIKYLAISLGLTLAVAAHGQFTPVNLTPETYNQDMVVEKAGPTPLIPGGATTASMDGGISNGGNSWNERGYFLTDPNVGLPPAGTTITTNNHTFTFAPSYTASNAVMMDVGYFSNSNFRVTTPATYVGLSFLTSGGNGGCQFRWTVQRQDGTSDTGTAASADWFSVPQNIAWIADGRVNAQDFTAANVGSANPRLYYVDAPVAASASPITNINIQFVSGNASGHSAILAFAGQTSAGGAYTPIVGTGYNADVVVEATAPRRWNLDPKAPATTASMDGGLNNTGDTWFEQGYYTPSNTFGLPAPGSTFSAQAAPDHQFKMPASYTANNAVFLDPSSPTATLTLATPSAFTALSLLTASANGTMNLEVTIHHQDGSTETAIAVSPDWFGGANVAVNSNGRINVQSGLFENLNSGNPRLYYADLLLANSASPVTTVDLSYTNTAGRSVVFALSGSTGPVRPVITTQPASVKTSAGANIQLTVGAAGTPPLTYQWQKGTNGVFATLANGGNVSGATTTTLSLNSVGAADLADYRAVVANAAGSSTSSVATVLVLSTLSDVTAPTDPITSVGGTSPDAEAVARAIDNTTSKYLNRGSGANPLNIPVGFVVTPAMGRTIVSGIRLYAANDAPERDPANYIIEGSNDGGTTYALISSNSVVVPDARNEGGAALDPVNQSIAQVTFANTVGYSSYRVTFSRVKGATDLFQIGEVELLGVADTSGFPSITLAPVPLTVYAGENAQFTVTATGTPAPTYQWRKGTNGVFVNIAGATTPTLNLNNVTLADAALYQVGVTNSVGGTVSAPVALRVVSTNADITTSIDQIVGFGDESGTRWGEATNALRLIDDVAQKWQNGGSGFSAAAGFPPFEGPVGFIITPSTPTLLSGIRFYTADDLPAYDPADYSLEGSVDGGNRWFPIAGGPLNLPAARNPNSSSVIIDPLTSAMQEVLFSPRGAFTSYRVTFSTVRDPLAASHLQLAEIQLLGVATTGVSPVLSVTRAGNGDVTITSSVAGTLQSAATLNPVGGTVWQNVGPISGSLTIPAAQVVQSRYYRVSVP